MLAFRKVFLYMLSGSLLIIALGWAASLLNVNLVLILVVLNLGMLIASSFMVCSGIYLPVHCSGNNSLKAISLSFDDGPDPVITPQVLDLLKEHNINATFFLIGKNIEKNEHILKRIIDEGHIIGNHSYAHHNFFGFWSAKKMRADLEQNARLIEDITGKKLKLFRPPFGVTNPNIAKAVRSLNYISIGWNIRSLDGIKKDQRKTIKRVLKRLKPGGIVLFHDNHDGIISILENVITYAKSEGYEIVPLSELLNINEYLD